MTIDPKNKRKKLEALLRRKDHLENLIKTWKRTGNPSYAKRELSALTVAVDLYLERWPYLALDPSVDESKEDAEQDEKEAGSNLNGA